MATPQQIELAKKYWYTQDQINQELATPWSVKRVAAIGAPTYEQPVWGTFASSIPKAPDVGQTSTWVNAWGDTTYNFTPLKPTIATTDKPVIGTPPATTPKTVDFTTMTPEQLKAQYMTIGTKLPWEVTDEDRRFAKYLQTRIGLGETMDKIFWGTGASSGKTTYSTELVQPWENIASSVRNSDGSYQVTYKDWTTQRTTTEPSTTVFPEWTPEYYAQKKAQENQKQIDILTEQMNAEAERRKKETAELVAKYGENIATQFQSQKAEIEAQGAKRMETLNSGLSFSGFGRSTLALDKRDEIAKNIETTINQAKAKADLELMAYRMEQEGADAEAISAMRANIANVQANIDQANYENQLEIIKLNQENATSGAEAMNNLLSVISNSAELQKDADLDASASLWYFVKRGADWKITLLFDSQWRPIKFEGNPQTTLTPEQQQNYASLIKSKALDEKILDNLSQGDRNAIAKYMAVQDGSWVWTWFNPWSGEMRTDRHNNPTAMTTDVAKTLGLVEWVDYTVWDPFTGGKGWKVYYTARLNGDGLQTTIKALDTAAKDPNKKAFYTQWGGQRWTYIGLSDEEWLSKTPEEKAQVIATMYKNEWGNGSINAGTFVVGGTGGGGGMSNAYSDSEIELLSELANMDASARNTALKAQWIPLKRVTDYMALAKAWKIPPTESQKQSSAQIMSQIQDLVSIDWNDATGFQINPFFSIGWTDRATAEGKIASLIATITLPNLGMLKWPMSDKDLAFIQNASTRLSTKQSDKEFEKQLIELYNIGARKNWMEEITKLSDIPKDRILAGQNQSTGTANTGGTVTPPIEGWQVVNWAI